MKKLLFVLILLTGCSTPVSWADITTMARYCEPNGGIKFIETLGPCRVHFECNNDLSGYHSTCKS